MSTGDQLLSNFDLYTEEQAPPTPELSHKLWTERSSSEGEPLGGPVSPPVFVSHPSCCSASQVLGPPKLTANTNNA